MKNRTAKQDAMLAAEATTDITKETAASGYARLMALQNDNIDAFMRLQAILRDGAVEWRNELMDLAGRQFQKQSNVATNWQVNGAAPFAAITSQVRQCQTYAEQCLEQTARFLHLAAKVARDSRLHLENHTATVIDHFAHHDGSFAVQKATQVRRRTMQSPRGGDDD